MKRDLRFAIRMLLKQPGFSLIAVLTLALGIGVTSAVFSLIQGVFGGVILTMLCVGVVAALVPARRALAVDPMILLRDE
jgi:ABC-type antimicrobial peptide transport system permease subunit